MGIVAGKTEANFADDRYASAEDLENALNLISTPNPQPGPTNRSTTKRTISRRGVIWLGQTCNLHCEFCYFIARIEKKDHPEHHFMPLEKAQKICDVLRRVYRNTSIDIEGGEPTIYPHILDLIEYCVSIRLYPTLITNALVLADKNRGRRFKEAGVRDFKISIHGLGEVHDKLVRRRGAHELQMKAIRNLRELGIPFRFNTVLTPAIVPQLPKIAKLAVASGALCVNWLGYNPHEDQEMKEGREALIPNFTLMRGPLTEALDILEVAGVESNVRYVPHCMVENRHRRSIYHFQQLFYDHREWDLTSWSWTTLQPQRETRGETSPPISVTALKWWARLSIPIYVLARLPLFGKWISIKRLVNVAWLLPLLYRIQAILISVPHTHQGAPRDKVYNKVARLHSKIDCESVHTDACRRCTIKAICSGMYRDYAEIFGTKEAVAIEGKKLITDPLYYISHQRKIVEMEDEVWALDEEA